MRCSPAGDDIGPSVTGHIFHNEVFGCHASCIHRVFLPLCGQLILTIVNDHSEGVGGIAVAKDDFVAAVSVNIRSPESVTSLETALDDVSVP